MAGTGGAGTVRLLRPGRPEVPVPAVLVPGLAPGLGLAVPGPNRAAGLLASAAPAGSTNPAAALEAAPGAAASPAVQAASAAPGPAGEAQSPVVAPEVVVSEASPAEAVLGAPGEAALAALAGAALVVPEAGASEAAELAVGNIQKGLSSFVGRQVILLRWAPQDGQSRQSNGYLLDTTIRFARCWIQRQTSCSPRKNDRI